MRGFAAWIGSIRAAIYFPDDPIYLSPVQGHYRGSIVTARTWKLMLLILLPCIKKRPNGFEPPAYGRKAGLAVRPLVPAPQMQTGNGPSSTGQPDLT